MSTSQESAALMAEVQSQKNSISPRELLIRYLPYLPWVIVCLLLSVLVAYLKLRYAPNVYSVEAVLMVKDPAVTGAGKDRMEDIMYASPNRNINDEIQVIGSRNMCLRVVRALGLHIQYYSRGNILTKVIEESESPIRIKILRYKDSLSKFSIPLTILNEKEFEIENSVERLFFGQPFELSQGSFVIERTEFPLANYSSKEFVVDYAPIESRADQLLGGFYAIQSGESNNIMKVNYESENPLLASSILNQWMKEYQLAGLDEKKLAAANSLAFINEQLESANSELGRVEKNILGIRQRNNIINPEAQSLGILNVIGEIDREVTELGVQNKIIDNMISYIGDTRNPYRQVGSLMGIQEPSLGNQVIEFNKLQVQRETLLKTTTRSNPIIVNMEATLEKLRTDIIQNLQNVKQGIGLTSRSLSKKKSEVMGEVSLMPAREKEILDVSRRQKILEQLYSFLLEKKLETSIMSASTIPNAKIIEYARSPGTLVSPNRKLTYIFAILLGFGIPSLVIFLLEYLNDRVRGRYDVNRMTEAPVIGEISHSDEESTLIVSRTSRRFIAEQFRIIRTNLKYIVPSEKKSVLMVTSSTSGEGKSFISTNIGAVMALAGRKTAILEFDIRKPKILKGLGIEKRPGLTNYLIGDMEIKDLPVPVNGIDNLYVVPCGPIPPNPSELLLDKKLDTFFKELMEGFDVLVIDTAPVGLVGDAMILGKYADATLYVIRHNYTFKKQLVMLDDVYVNKRLPRLSLILNDISTHASYGGYYGYGGYGYSGYGYVQGYDYFDQTRKNKQRHPVLETLMKPVEKALDLIRSKRRK